MYRVFGESSITDTMILNRTTAHILSSMFVLFTFKYSRGTLSFRQANMVEKLDKPQAQIVLAIAISFLSVTGCASPDVQTDVRPVLTSQESGTSALLIGAHAVNDSVVWLSGTNGVYARTLDGGANWETSVVPGADSLQFRDVHAFDAETAFLLSIGPGEQSRIFRTRNGGKDWTVVYRNDEPEAFFDCLDFWDERTGIAFSDAVDGSFVIIRTDDGGDTWRRVAPESLPPALPGEGGFAASGTCLVTSGDSAAYVGTGNGERSRLLFTKDRGETWDVVDTPLPGDEARGITSVAVLDREHLSVLGGDLTASDRHSAVMAFSDDEGLSWTVGDTLPFNGAVYGATYVAAARKPLLVAVGPGGAAYSENDGVSWTPIDSTAYWSLTFASPANGWLVGPEGKITHVAFSLP